MAAGRFVTTNQKRFTQSERQNKSGFTSSHRIQPIRRMLCDQAGNARQNRVRWDWSTYDSGAHTWTSQRPPATSASTRAARPADRIPSAQVRRTTGLAGPPSTSVAAEASASGTSGSAAVAVPTSSAGAGRREASTDWRLETRAAGRGLRLGASSPELSAIGFAAGESLSGMGKREGYERRKEAAVVGVTGTDGEGLEMD